MAGSQKALMRKVDELTKQVAAQRLQLVDQSTVRGGAFREMCDDRGIKQYFITPGTPQLNGVVDPCGMPRRLV